MEAPNMRAVCPNNRAGAPAAASEKEKHMTAVTELYEGIVEVDGSGDVEAFAHALSTSLPKMRKMLATLVADGRMVVDADGIYSLPVSK